VAQTEGSGGPLYAGRGRPDSDGLDAVIRGMQLAAIGYVINFIFGLKSIGAVVLL